MNLYKVIFKNSHLFAVAKEKKQIKEKYGKESVKIYLIEKNIEIFAPF